MIPADLHPDKTAFSFLECIENLLFVNQSYDYRPNWTPLSPITVINFGSTMFQPITAFPFSKLDPRVLSVLHRRNREDLGERKMARAVQIE